MRELTSLKGAIIEKIYHVGDEVLFHLYHDHNKKILRVIMGRLIHLTNYAKVNPQVPTSFCMYLRKYLKGSRIIGLSQPDYERVIIISFRKKEETYKVVFELFGSGNIIITTDTGLIKHCIRFQRFSARVIKPGVKYKLPPSNINLSTMNLDTFKKIIRTSNKPDIVRTLAVNINIGGTYAEEACLNANINKTLKPTTITDESLKELYNAIQEIINKAKTITLKPRVILKGEEPIDVTPFELNYYKSNKSKEFTTFNEAIDFFYARTEKLESESKKEEIINLRKTKILNKLKQQEEYVKELKNESIKLKNKAQLIKNNLYLIERIIKSLLRAHEKGYTWTEIKQMIEQEKNNESQEAKLIKELKPENNELILNLADGIKITLNSDVRTLMNELFEKSKKLERKITGAIEAVERTKKELNNTKTIIIKENTPRMINRKSKEWFEKFKWSRTSEGLLAITGRNAQQNEQLINNYLEPNDLVFHAEIHGSPFTILRKGREANKESIKEAAQFTAIHSSSWSKGSPVNVYYIKPYQVDKNAPSGEYLRTGGFMIHGKKTYIKSLKMELSIGINIIGELNYKIISGPKNVIKNKCKHFATIEPGTKDKTIITHELNDFFKQKGFKINFEDIKATLPDGGSRITGLI